MSDQPFCGLAVGGPSENLNAQPEWRTCLQAKRGGLTVTACDFTDKDRTQMTTEADMDAALVYENRFRGRARLADRAGEQALIEMYVVSKA